MTNPVLRISLLEPNTAYAAELGQILSDALVDFSFELLRGEAGADFLLMNATAALTEPPQNSVLVFNRTAEGVYTACSLCGHAAILDAHKFNFPLPLTEAVLQLAAATAVAYRETPTVPAWPKTGTTPVDAAEKIHRRLLQAQKMEAVGELAGGIAHDFNNLLMVIRGYTEMLLEDHALSSSSSHHAQAILAASQKATLLTRELLAFSRKQPVELKPINLNLLVEHSVPMLSRLVGKNIMVWAQLPRDLWPIQADLGQMEQMLLNLSTNARDAMPNGGKLLLETSNVVIEQNQAAMQRGEYVMLAVSDTGQGIPRDVLPRIFEPFFTTKERGKGTGLGLASVYGIVKQSGGYIWAYSEAGYGTTFKIYLPRATAAQLSAKSAVPQLVACAAAASRQ